MDTYYINIKYVYVWAPLNKFLYTLLFLSHFSTDPKIPFQIFVERFPSQPLRRTNKRNEKRDVFNYTNRNKNENQTNKAIAEILFSCEKCNNFPLLQIVIQILYALY